MSTEIILAKTLARVVIPVLEFMSGWPVGGGGGRGERNKTGKLA